MDIPFDGQYDRKTFLQALRLVQRTSKVDKVLRIAVLCAALALLGTFLSHWANNGKIEYYRPLIAIPLLLYSANHLLSAWWTAYRLFQKRPSRAIGGRANAQGILLLSKMAPGKQRQIPWKAFRRAGYGADIIGLLANDGTLWVFRQEFFGTLRQWEAFQQLVKKNIPESPKNR
ncbi:MAG: hypothetical protein ACUVRJ_08650 [Candidatus Villigracilaceae bacterium]